MGPFLSSSTQKIYFQILVCSDLLISREALTKNVIQSLLRFTIFEMEIGLYPSH